MRSIPKWVAISGFMLSQTLSQAYAAGTTTIAAFGDSLFAGYGVAAADSFPVKLEQRLKADGYKVKVLNLSVSGDTTSGGISRVDSVLAQKPDLVILELGGNDMLRGFQPETTQINLKKILDKLKLARVKIILAGHVAPLDYGSKFANEYNAIFPALADEYKVQLYPNILEGIRNNGDLLQSDGIHPTAKGVEIMVVGMIPAVEQLLKK